MTRQLDQLSAALDRSHNLDAEQAALGGCFLRPALVATLELDPCDFFDPRHKVVWEAMQALERDRVPIDELSVEDVLKRAGRLDAVGGLAYLSQLALRVPTEDSTEHYARIVRDHACRRKLLYLGGSIARLVLDGDDLGEVLGEVQRELSACEPRRVGGGGELGVAAAEECRAIVAELDDVARGRTVGVPTGVTILDAQIGGLPVGVPSVVGARPAMGKSTLALNIALHAARQGGFGVHVLTFEDSRKMFAQRLLSMESGVDVGRVGSRHLEPAETAALMQASDGLRGLKGLHVEHGHGLDARAVARRVRSRRREINTRLVVVDYVQRVPHPDRRLRRHEQLDDSMNVFAELAGQEDLAVLVLSQLTRPERGKEDACPTLEDFKGSGAIEEAGKLIIGLHKSKQQGEIDLLVLKNAQGPQAQVIARWDRAHCRIW
jgi:replicative DNA helicase